MAGDRQNSGEAVQVVLQARQGGDVQVVGGLVQEQHVGVGDQDLQQIEAAFSPPRACPPQCVAVSRKIESVPAFGRVSTWPLARECSRRRNAESR